MPYLIINDAEPTVHYFTGQGFVRGSDTTVELSVAKRFHYLGDAVEIMSKRGELYAVGWRIVPVK